MKKQNKTLFSKDEKQKAIDMLLWLNFKERTQGNSYKIYKKNRNFAILKSNYPEGMYRYYSIRIFRKNYSCMTYNHISEIAKDNDPLKHWETIRGMFSVIDGEILRYILHAKIPLKKFIRYELACRGYDENFKWVGFEDAKKIWLK